MFNEVIGDGCAVYGLSEEGLRSTALPAASSVDLAPTISKRLAQVNGRSVTASKQSRRVCMKNHTRGRQAMIRVIALKSGDRQVLDHLQTSVPSKAVARCADMLKSDYFRFHRGAMTVRGYKIVFGNDGFSVDKECDLRSQLEVVRVVRTINRINTVWKQPVIQITGFGLCCDGYSWAMRIKTDYFNWAGILDTAVWDAWFRACAQVTGRNVHPFPGRLEYEIQHMYLRSVKAA